jgi:(2Fe-2S) ferredoxin
MREPRPILIHIIVCRGCSGRDDVAAWLRQELRRRRVSAKVSLSVSDCLGPCARGPVVTAGDSEGVVWLGGLSDTHYRALLEWATRCAETGVVHGLPGDFRGHAFNRFAPAGSSA